MTLSTLTLRTARRIKGVTQLQLSRLAMVDVTLISLLETGKRPYANVAYGTIVRLARSLGVSPEELFPVELSPACAPPEMTPDLVVMP